MAKMMRAAAVAAAVASCVAESPVELAFQGFVAKYGKAYTADELPKRFEAFSKAFAYVEEENSKGRSYKVELNEFSDQLPEELSSTRLGLKVPESGKLFDGVPLLGTDDYTGVELPSEVDWVAKGAVTDPKNQGTCGSCWSFSTTGALEGAWQIATGELVSLSEQELVDCAKSGNMGCHGGSMDAAFQYLESNALCTEKSYPYVAKDGTCHASGCKKGIPKGAVVGFKDVTSDEKAIMEAVSKQPVSVAIEADQMAFQLYKGGVLTKECGAKLDHGVLLVGYGTEDGVDYWKVKNSWGPQWGEKGFIRLQRGKSHDGECGINLGAVYPVVNGKASSAADAKDTELEEAFEAFIAKYNKIYETTEERAQRYQAFKQSYEYVQEQSKKNSSYTVALNEFADQTPSEMQAVRLGINHEAFVQKLWSGMPHLGTHKKSGATLPPSVDWVAKGAVTEPKNQGTCGSCWSFSTTGALEGAWQIASGKLVSLSEQQLVDCSKNDGNSGCNGGGMDGAFTYLEKNDVCTEESYPYAAKQGTCTQSSCSSAIPAGGVTGFKDVPTENKEALMDAVAQQPVSVAIEADQMAFQLYNGGILSKECGTKLDHGVLLVGYGTDNGMDYWKVKNSWGGSWGEQGYVRIQRGKNKEGECGIKLGASYPVVKAAAGDEIVV
eukprot:TRINITY_DN1565_c0_g1_i1.p1 TRINITY_DN1565_c0_g1~~TRINITY_DN1565_c0_g1_i1.p1  ORF type:complete len:723 (+),score=238.83 TRINITY_DN1565_c0_g1_i1:176-2170(+)